MKPTKLLIWLKFYHEFIEYLNQHQVVGFILAIGVSFSMVIWSIGLNFESCMRIIEALK